MEKNEGKDNIPESVEPGCTKATQAPKIRGQQKRFHTVHTVNSFEPAVYSGNQKRKDWKCCQYFKARNAGAFVPGEQSQRVAQHQRQE